jgi:hypothetical protein
MGDSTYGDRDTVIQLRFDADNVNLNFNSPGSDMNNGVQLYEQNDDMFSDVLAWDSVGVWYNAVVNVDGTAQTVAVELIDPAGTSLGTSAPIAFDGTRLDAISVQSVAWNPSTNVVWIDELAWE